MKHTLNRFIGLCFTLLSLAMISLVSGCGSGNDGERPVTQLIFQDIEIINTQTPKTIKITWDINEPDLVKFYRLEYIPDSSDSYTEYMNAVFISPNSFRAMIPVHLIDWFNTTFHIVALDATGKILGTSDGFKLSGHASPEGFVGYFKAGNPDAEDEFGSSIALSADGHILAVGAINESSSDDGVGADQDNNNATNAGAVYIFAQNDDGYWINEAFIKAEAPDPEDLFGFSIALSGDGNTLAVCSPGEDSNSTGVNGDPFDNSSDYAGAVYVYTRSSQGVWRQQAFIKANNTDAGDMFGSSVALSFDGDTLAVGAYREDSGSTEIDGDVNDNSAPNSGAAYVLIRDESGHWMHESYIKAINTEVSDQFGIGVSLSGDGNTLAVSAHQEMSMALEVNGDHEDNSLINAGAVYIYARSDQGKWFHQAYIKSSNTDSGDRFGMGNISLSSSGNILAVGAAYECSVGLGIGSNQNDNSLMEAGAVYIYSRDADNTWNFHTYVKASNTDESDRFGSSVSLSCDGRFLAVGSPGEDSAAFGVDGNPFDNTLPNSGAVYLFRSDDQGHWYEQSYIKAGNPDQADSFGYRVALSSDGTTLAVSAQLEDSNATEIDGNQNDNSLKDSGAVYLY